MVEKKVKKIVELDPKKRGLKVPKLDQTKKQDSLPNDYHEILELWGDEAKELLTRKFATIEEALNEFVGLMLKRHELTPTEKEHERKHLLETLGTDEAFKQELRGILKF